MSASEKLENDYKTYVKNVEDTADADIEKIRSDLNALKAKAAQYSPVA